jgi:hypothetical protein
MILLPIETIVVAAWLVFPLAMAMFFLPAYYDNARQFLFILPPVFLFGSLGIGVLWNAVRPALARSRLSCCLGSWLLCGFIHINTFTTTNSWVGCAGLNEIMS